MAKVVATDEPDTAAKIMQVSTQVMGRPPCTPPTMLLAKSTSRREMPPVSIRLPARMKKGMAASGNLLTALKISFTEISMLAWLTWMPTTDASPIDTATDTLSAKPSIMVMSMAMVMRASRPGAACPCPSLNRPSCHGAVLRPSLRRLQFHVARVQVIGHDADDREDGAHRHGHVGPEHGQLFQAGHGLHLAAHRVVPAPP